MKRENYQKMLKEEEKSLKLKEVELEKENLQKEIGRKLAFIDSAHKEMESKKLKAFMETFLAVNMILKNIFSQLSPGGKSYMMLEREEDPFSGGVSLVVKPRGKEVQYLEAISGGEKTLAALSLIFAIFFLSPEIYTTQRR